MSDYYLTSSASFISDDELYHYGIKGQKWGVRRYQNKDGSLTAAGKKRKSSPDAKEKETRKADVKNRRTMSDADLKKRIERMKLEKEYKSLVDEDIAPGKKYVSDILSAAGKKTLTMAAAGALAYGVKVAMTKQFNIKEAAQFIAANPNKKK